MIRYLVDTKEYIRQAIIAKGAPCPTTDTFRQYKDEIAAIPTGGGDIVYYYKAGDQCTDISGGWWECWSYAQSTPGTVDFNEDNIQITTVYMNRITVATRGQIDVTTIDTIYFDIENVESAYGQNDFRLGLATSPTADMPTVKPIVVSNTTITNVYNIDVSDLTGLYYINISRAHQGYIKIHNVWGHDTAI